MGVACGRAQVHTYVCRLAGRRVTLHTLYFLRMVPQCVTSTFRPAGEQMQSVGAVQQAAAGLHHLPLISLVNLTLWESARGRGCSSMLWMSRISHMNWMTGWAL